MAGKYGMKITKIACGENHTMAIMEEDSEESKNQRVFVWGHGKNWQLGLKDLTESMHGPHQMDSDLFDLGVSNIFAAHNYSCIISQNGEVDFLECKSNK